MIPTNKIYMLKIFTNHKTNAIAYNMHFKFNIQIAIILLNKILFKINLIHSVSIFKVITSNNLNFRLNLYALKCNYKLYIAHRCIIISSTDCLSIHSIQKLCIYEYFPTFNLIMLLYTNKIFFKLM